MKFTTTCQVRENSAASGAPPLTSKLLVLGLPDRPNPEPTVIASNNLLSPSDRLHHYTFLIILSQVSNTGTCLQTAVLNSHQNLELKTFHKISVLVIYTAQLPAQTILFTKLLLVQLGINPLTLGTPLLHVHRLRKR